MTFIFKLKFFYIQILLIIFNKIDAYTYVEKDEELRAVWVSTVANIDIPRIETEEQFKGYLISILEKWCQKRF